MSKSGILLLNKPAGISSARVLTPLKRRLTGSKIGHTGTLDPFAEGLLVVLVGAATRLSSWFLSSDKRYRATIALGAETDTLDTEGSIVEEAAVPDFAALDAVRPQFIGAIAQVPPSYSALKVEGKRAYQLARAGTAVAIAAREVRIFNLDLTPTESPDAVAMDVHCGSGTYVRSLARDLPRAVGSRGYCRSLQRYQVGPFRLEDAISVSDDTTAGELRAHIIPVTTALRALGGFGEIVISPEAAHRARHGKAVRTVVPVEELNAAGSGRGATLLLEASTGEEVAILENSDGHWRYRMVFPPGAD